MRRRRPPPDLRCPTCGAELSVVVVPMAEDGSYPMHCPRCGTSFRARPRSEPRRERPRPPIGDLALFFRSRLLRGVFGVYRLGLGLGTVGLLASGGFVLVLRGWLNDSVTNWSDLIRTLGGVSVKLDSTDPDADFGPILRRSQAPPLFDLLADLAARLDIRPPEEVRLAFLPCCGVVAWRKSRALLLGLPLLSVLDVAELRAVLAHELAHLARGDATWSARLIRSVEALDRALGRPDRETWGPLRWWALFCRRIALGLLGPIAQGQEARADRSSAVIAGGRNASSALVKVALVQPLFRELLEVIDTDPATSKNLYATFRLFWERLPEPLVNAMRLQLLIDTESPSQSPHPPLADRVAQLLTYPDRPAKPVEREPALTLLGDLDWIEQMMHDRLYKPHAIEPTVFHHAGT